MYSINLNETLHVSTLDKAICAIIELQMHFFHNFIFGISYATRPLSRCYIRTYLVKNSAGAHKEPSKKYKNNLRTLKSKSYEQCRTKHDYYTSITLKNLSYFHDLLSACKRSRLCYVIDLILWLYFYIYNYYFLSIECH